MDLIAAGAVILCGMMSDKPFLSPPEYVGPPDNGHAPHTRRFQGIPSLAISPEGRLWATWYAGPEPAEDKNNYVVLATSGDDGATWWETLVVDPDGAGPVRAFDPQVWVDPGGSLWVFWAQAIGHDTSPGGVWAVVTGEPGAPNPRWSEPRRLTDGVMMCKPTVLSTGEWLLPASTWYQEDGARAVVSTDRGETWRVQGACNVPKEARNADEHMVAERTDGSLWMLVRTTYGIGESVSEDRGRTWSPLTPSDIPHPTARFFIRRLASGSLLLVKHGPMDERIGRSHLRAFISEDDGATWQGGLLLDERAGVSYPDGQQGKDGVIRIIYDYDRTGEMAILMAAFTETDVRAGQWQSASGRRRVVVSRPHSGEE